MKKRVYLFILFTLCFSEILLAREIIPFKECKEELTFSINYMGIPVGRNTMSIERSFHNDYKDCYLLKILTRSLPFFSLFYKVEDIIESIVNIKSLQPYRFKKDLKEGAYFNHETIIFDYKKRLAYVNKYPIRIPNKVFDPLSALYYVRTKDLKIGESLYLNVVSSKKVHRLEVRVLRKEKLTTIFGRIKTIVIKPIMAFEGIFKHHGEILIWLTDDSYKIPVLMKGKIIIGSIYAILTKKVSWKYSENETNRFK